MEFDLFLWPMVIPMIIPLIYCVKYKRKALTEIGIITLAMVLIVVLYWPLLTSNLAFTHTYPVVKLLLFLLLPLALFLVIKHDTSPLHGAFYGVTKQGIRKSLFWFLLFLPIMLVVSGLIQYFIGATWGADPVAGIISFFEAFTEEFFFRGILFIFLLQKTNMKIAYVTSLACFILVHPQNLTSLFIVGTIIQGIVTLEIARRSQNIIGSWMLHGSNRFFELAILPLFL
jgi:membrane protease YdiL (CAAX protease family)